MSPKSRMPLPGLAGVPRTILLIDDERDVREPIDLALRDAGYRVIEAAGWDQALQVMTASQARIDLILTDLVMPDRAGLATLLRLRDQPQGRVPLIVFSAHPLVMRLLDGAVDGVVEWLEKPLDAAIIVEAVNRSLHGLSAE